MPKRNYQADDNKLIGSTNMQELCRASTPEQATRDGGGELIGFSEEAPSGTDPAGATSATRRTKRRAGGANVNDDNKGTCQVPGCSVQLSELDGFNLRCHICNEHRHAEVVEFPEGLRKRFCQQCNKFHPLDEFVGSKRGCEAKLLKHNIRQRKRRMQRRVREQQCASGSHKDMQEEYGEDLLEPYCFQDKLKKPGVLPAAGGRMRAGDGLYSSFPAGVSSSGDHRGPVDFSSGLRQQRPEDSSSNPYFYGGMEDLAAGWGLALSSAYPGILPQQISASRRDLSEFPMGRGRQPSAGHHPFDGYAATTSDFRIGMGGVPAFPYFSHPGPQTLQGGREYEMEWIARAREWMQNDSMPGVSSRTSVNSHLSSSPSTNHEYVRLSIRIANMNPDMLPAEVHKKVLELMHAGQQE